MKYGTEINITTKIFFLIVFFRSLILTVKKTLIQKKHQENPKLAWVFLILLVFVFGCAQTGNPFLDDPQYCNVDADCTMSRLDVGDKCFPANKLSASKIHAEANIIESCERKEVKCISNKCTLVEKKVDKLDKCYEDSHCVPKQCCHATDCVLKGQEENCAGIACTEDCRGGTIDCGGGCECIQGKCKAKYVNFWEN